MHQINVHNLNVLCPPSPSLEDVNNVCDYTMPELQAIVEVHRLLIALLIDLRVASQDPVQAWSECAACGHAKCLRNCHQILTPKSNNSRHRSGGTASCGSSASAVCMLLMRLGIPALSISAEFRLLWYNTCLEGTSTTVFWMNDITEAATQQCRDTIMQMMCLPEEIVSGTVLTLKGDVGVRFNELLGPGLLKAFCPSTYDHLRVQTSTLLMEGTLQYGHQPLISTL
ncbi:hypothetical protein C8J57DRAFT_1245084 [Mycena rebaudengoi]|nr:hypothetical protein C8J57DRAFT_1245084 [Mycena rebaudengoi]